MTMNLLSNLVKNPSIRTQLILHNFAMAAKTEIFSCSTMWFPRRQSMPESFLIFGRERSASRIRAGLLSDQSVRPRNDQIFGNPFGTGSRSAIRFPSHRGLQSSNGGSTRTRGRNAFRSRLAGHADGSRYQPSSCSSKISVQTARRYSTAFSLLSHSSSR
jgi:hypothetical protein